MLTQAAAPLAGGDREGVAAAHAHTDHRDAAGVDVLAPHQVGGGVHIVGDHEPRVVVEAGSPSLSPKPRGSNVSTV